MQQRSSGSSSKASSGSSRLFAALARTGLYAASNVAVTVGETLAGILLFAGYRWWRDPAEFKEQWQKDGMKGKIKLLNDAAQVPITLGTLSPAMGFHTQCVASLQKAVQQYAGII